MTLHFRASEPTKWWAVEDAYGWTVREGDYIVCIGTEKTCRLIAAAPDLLAALKEMVEKTEVLAPFREAWLVRWDAKARALISELSHE
jgi:hypothetical protein